MKALLGMEWLRFRRNPVNLWIVAVFGAALFASALWSGFSARQWRAAGISPAAEQQAANAAEMHDTPAAEAGKPTFAAVASAGRIAHLPALAGLALQVGQMQRLAGDIKVSVRSRHTDGRSGDRLYNPLLHELGLPDFAEVLALLLPLAVVALCYGLVQAEREIGVWRLVCTQISKPWHLVFTALALRYAVLLVVTAIASLAAFGLDPGGSVQAYGFWLAVVASAALAWFGLAGLILSLPISSGAGAVAMLGLWLALSFGLPAGLGWAAERQAPMPSRLQTIVEIRHWQEQIGQQRAVLLDDWYARHPAVRPAKPLSELPREIAGLPAGLALDARIRPLMAQFDRVRERQFDDWERWSALSPTVSLMLAAQRLAGTDAPRYAAFMAEVDRFEDHWRDFFVPPMMAQAAVSPAVMDESPQFHFSQPEPAGCGGLILRQLAVAGSLLALLWLGRRRFAKP